VKFSIFIDVRVHCLPKEDRFGGHLLSWILESKQIVINLNVYSLTFEGV